MSEMENLERSIDTTPWPIVNREWGSLNAGKSAVGEGVLIKKECIQCW